MKTAGDVAVVSRSYLLPIVLGASAKTGDPKPQRP